MHFKSRLDVSSSDTLAFLATATGVPGEVLVKLVHGDYGLAAHQTLYDAGFAPALYGIMSHAAAPTAYVMEYLPAPMSKEGTGWVTLHEFEKLDAKRSAGERKTYKERIWPALEEILGAMKEKAVVHGDLRPNNIMVKVSGGSLPDDVKLKIIDFDWGGSVTNKVRYPLLRNTAIRWPAGEGDLIQPEHDSDLVQGWWNNFLLEKPVAGTQHSR